MGLVSCALQVLGIRSAGPHGYGLRNLAVGRFLSCARDMGLTEAAGVTMPGDVLLFRLSAAQFHVGIISTQGDLVHAHAGLGRVVVTPLIPTWPVEGHWRVADA